MHEDQLLTSLLDKYRNKNQSFSRVITDPAFKAMPLVDKVRLLKENGHIIREGSRYDSRFNKDLAAGALGTAVMLYEPILGMAKTFKTGFDYGHELGVKNSLGESYSGSPPNLDLSGFKDVILKASGTGIAAKQFTKAYKDHRTLALVKKLLSEQPEENTDLSAINLIARS